MKGNPVSCKYELLKSEYNSSPKSGMQRASYHLIILFYVILSLTHYIILCNINPNKCYKDLRSDKV